MLEIVIFNILFLMVNFNCISKLCRPIYSFEHINRNNAISILAVSILTFTYASVVLSIASWKISLMAAIAVGYITTLFFENLNKYFQSTKISKEILEEAVTKKIDHMTVGSFEKLQGNFTIRYVYMNCERVITVDSNQNTSMNSVRFQYLCRYFKKLLEDIKNHYDSAESKQLNDRKSKEEKINSMTKKWRGENLKLLNAAREISRGKWQDYNINPDKVSLIFAIFHKSKLIDETVDVAIKERISDKLTELYDLLNVLFVGKMPHILHQELPSYSKALKLKNFFEKFLSEPATIKHTNSYRGRERDYLDHIDFGIYSLNCFIEKNNRYKVVEKLNTIILQNISFPYELIDLLFEYCYGDFVPERVFAS